LQIWHGYAKSEGMPSNPDQPPERPASEAVPDPGRETPLSAAAQRALAEAAARRAESERKPPDQPKEVQPKEVGGRDGPDPTRYGDWEVNGLASDF
jgi:hypothetical protein